MISTPGSKRFALVTVMIGMIICGFYLIIWEPIHSRTEMLRKDVQQLGQKIQSYKVPHLDRKKLRAKINELERRLYGGYPDVQEEIDQKGLRNRVAGIALDHQLDITHWRPEASGEESPEKVQNTPVRIQIEGGYHQVAQFFSRVLQMPDTVGISQFTMSVTDDQPENFNLQTNFILATLNPLLHGEGPQLGSQLSNEDVQGSGL